MKHLIVYTHFNPESFTKSVVTEIERVNLENGHDVIVIDLYKDGFNPVLDQKDIGYMYQGEPVPEEIQKYHDLINWADHISFVYPLWWAQMPAILKGFIDRVFSNGYAFTYDENGAVGLLTGKKVNVFINTGAPNEYYTEIGMHKSLEQTNNDGIFEFCGMESKTVFFGNVAMGTDEERKAYLESIKTYYS
ncbi:NAD(P)H-dependent oxidoreductase [Aureivirga sp. CE67]|uniref:NAD(P)H-dependent oxidoreductase n=1 Tax=Aureivirga sp. CE67 TaxID=1788983 RepID=UPI0018CA8CC4|nr:NAD(P)H-dependent oxidoreductase [Aureivirga sp. CE67]